MDAEHGYTLQRHDDGQPLFLCFQKNAAVPTPGAWWSPDPKHAVLFVGRLDAERYLEIHQPHMISLTQVTPHSRVPG